MEYLKIKTFKEGYGVDQVSETITVGELISLLEDDEYVFED